MFTFFLIAAPRLVDAVVANWTPNTIFKESATLH